MYEPLGSYSYVACQMLDHRALRTCYTATLVCAELGERVRTLNARIRGRR